MTGFQDIYEVMICLLADVGRISKCFVRLNIR